MVDNAVVGFIYQQYEYDLIGPKVSYTWTPFDAEYCPGSLNYSSAYITT